MRTARVGTQSNGPVLRGVFRCAAAQQRFVCVLDFCAAARSVPCFWSLDLLGVLRTKWKF